MPDKQGDYQTKRSRYARYNADVRSTYPRFPSEWFWTWLTGKARQTGMPRKPVDTLLTPTQMTLQILWGYSVIVGAVVTAAHVGGVAVTILAWLLVVNRTRGLLHSFHYTTHGAGVRNPRLARVLANHFMSTPILHLTWDEYHKIHIRDHHSFAALCTDEDPDQQFMTKHGFTPRMSALNFWFKLLLSPFHPVRIWEHLWFRLRHNFVAPPWKEILPRAAFWLLLLSTCAAKDWLGALALYYLVPVLLITQYSSYIQHVTEHLWYPDKPEDVPRPVYVGSLTWGRFQGTPYPSRDTTGHTGLGLAFARAQWVLRIVLADLPIRLFSFMQDLPSHDFHHRSPRVNFWAITTERANAENRISDFGPMTETWSTLESIFILRDNLVYGNKDPFGIYVWWRKTQRPAKTLHLQGERDEASVGCGAMATD